MKDEAGTRGAAGGNVGAGQSGTGRTVGWGLNQGRGTGRDTVGAGRAWGALFRN